jgi:hypothetical protein
LHVNETEATQLIQRLPSAFEALVNLYDDLSKPAMCAAITSAMNYIFAQNKGMGINKIDIGTLTIHCLYPDLRMYMDVEVDLNKQGLPQFSA